MAFNSPFYYICDSYDDVSHVYDSIFYNVYPINHGDDVFFHKIFPFKIQTKLDNSLIINFSFIPLYQDVKRK